MTTDAITVQRGNAPLLLSMPHSGQELLGLEPRLISAWLARKDTDWHIPQLYEFAAGLDATIVRTSVSRTVIDVNRDPSGRSLYPGQATTELCPLTTFDGEPLYRAGAEPTAEEIGDRRRRCFDPYHRTLHAELARLSERHPRVVLYDCHSIRSVIPRLFEGSLPQCNIGTSDGRACDAALTAQIVALCAASGFSHVVNGRFKGGYITRSCGNPSGNVHAVQMELACRGYMREPGPAVDPQIWPSPYDSGQAAALQSLLQQMLQSCIDFARRH